MIIGIRKVFPLCFEKMFFCNNLFIFIDILWIYLCFFIHRHFILPILHKFIIERPKQQQTKMFPNLSELSSKGLSICSQISPFQVLRQLFILSTLHSMLAPHIAEAASLRDFGIIMDPKYRRQRQPIQNSCQLEQSSATQVHGILDNLRNIAHRLYTLYVSNLFLSLKI